MPALTKARYGVRTERVDWSLKAGDDRCFLRRAPLTTIAITPSNASTTQNCQTRQRSPPVREHVLRSAKPDRAGTISRSPGLRWGDARACWNGLSLRVHPMSRTPAIANSDARGFAGVLRSGSRSLAVDV